MFRKCTIPFFIIIYYYIIIFIFISFLENPFFPVRNLTLVFLQNIILIQKNSVYLAYINKMCIFYYFYFIEVACSRVEMIWRCINHQEQQPMATTATGVIVHLQRPPTTKTKLPCWGTASSFQPNRTFQGWQGKRNQLNQLKHQRNPRIKSIDFLLYSPSIYTFIRILKSTKPEKKEFFSFKLLKIYFEKFRNCQNIGGTVAAARGDAEGA